MVWYGFKFEFLLEKNAIIDWPKREYKKRPSGERCRCLAYDQGLWGIFSPASHISAVLFVASLWWDYLDTLLEGYHLTGETMYGSKPLWEPWGKDTNQLLAIDLLDFQPHHDVTRHFQGYLFYYRGESRLEGDSCDGEFVIRLLTPLSKWSVSPQCEICRHLPDWTISRLNIMPVKTSSGKKIALLVGVNNYLKADSGTRKDSKGNAVTLDNLGG